MTARTILAAQLATLLCLIVPSSRAATRATHDLGDGCTAEVRLMPEVPDDGRVASDRCSCDSSHELVLTSNCCEGDVRLVAGKPETSPDGDNTVVTYPYTITLGDRKVSGSLSVTCVPPASGGCSSGQCSDSAGAGNATLLTATPPVSPAAPTNSALSIVHCAFDISLGRLPGGGSAGFVRLGWDGAGAPAASVLPSRADYVSIEPLPGGLRVIAPECFALVSSNASGLAVSVFPASALPDSYYGPAALRSAPLSAFTATATGSVFRVVGGFAGGADESVFTRHPDGALSLQVNGGPVRTLAPGPGFSVVETVASSEGAVVSRAETVYDSALRPLSVSVTDPANPAIRIQHSAFEYDAEGRLVSAVRPDGSWERRAYGPSGALLSVATPLGDQPPETPDALCRVTAYSYAPVTSADLGLARFAGVARTVSVAEGGVPVSLLRRECRTGIGGVSVVTEERAPSPDAPWGAPGALRTVTGTYPRTAPPERAGRPAFSISPDGSMTWHEYAPFNSSTLQLFNPSTLQPFDLSTASLVSTTWRNVVSNEVSFAELPLRTVRETVVEDDAGRELYAETAVCAAPDEYETVSWRGTERDSRGRAVRVSRSDGTAEETSWGCCLPESRTAADGTRTEYAYDSQKREVLRVEYAPGRPPRTTSTSYDAAGRVVGRRHWAGGTFNPSTLQLFNYAYDAAGRAVFERGPDGVPVRHVYSADGLTVATVRGEGELAVTNATVRQRDGRVAQTLLNGVPRETYAYAPLSATLFTGPAGTNSPAFRTTHSDFLGRPAAEITPAFGGGLLVATNLYDARGLLASTKTLHLPASAPGEHSAFGIVHSAFRLHDALGERVVEASDRDGDGLLSLAADAATSNATAYAKIGGDWWEVSSSWTFPIEGSAEPVLSNATRRRLTGLGAPTTRTSPSSGGAVARSATGGVLLSETVTADALGNETIARRTLDPSTGLVTDETLTPASALPALSYTLGGLLVSNVTATGVTTLYGYDALGRKTSVTDGRGNGTIYSYDERGNLVSETDATGAVTSYAYDALNRRTAVMHNAQCTMQNGGGGNPSTLQPFNSSTTFTAYDAEDRVIAQWGATYPVLYSYDAFGRLATLSTTRDDEAAGQLATDHWPLATGDAASGVAWDTTRWNYDESTGLLTNKLYADGLGPSYSYTPDGKLASRAWARGVVTSYAYDYAGNLTNVMQNAECRMQNGGGGNSVNSVNPVETTYTYDRVGHMLSAIVEGVSTNRYAYSLHGQLTNEIQNGVSIARFYDTLNRPTGYSLMHDAQCTMHNGVGANPSTLQPFNLSTVTYSYDSLGRFASVSAPGGTRFVASANPSTLQPFNLSTTFTYSYLPGTDLVSGHTASAGGSGGAATRPLFSRSVAYEPHRNLIAAITNSFTNPSTLQPFNLSTFAYANDALGRRSSITRTGAAFGDLSGVTDAYGYNLRSEVVSSRRTLSDSPVRGFDYDYAYDPIGNRTSATDYDEQGNALVSSYSANALNQYTQRTVPGYATVRGEVLTNATITVNERPTFRQGSFFYGGDSADNTTSNLWKELEVYAAINLSGTNTPDIVSATTGTVFIVKTPEQFTYDADGNMTSDGRFHYTWNGENRLVCASNAEVVVTYAYDHRGRMVRKEISHRGTEARRIEYLWDDWNIIRETITNLSTFQPFNHSTDYVWGLDLDGALQGAGGVGGLLAVLRSDCAVTNSAFCILHSALYFPTYDANGNISEYVSDSGEIVAHYDYSPFGEPLVASSPLAATFSHQFSTKPWCAVTGFNEYVYRKYRPDIGRWMSRDPIGEYLDYGLYGFVRNQAQEHADYIGLVPIDWSNPVIPPDQSIPPGHDLIIPDIPRLPEPYNPIFLPPSYPPIPFDYPLPCREWYEQLPSCPCSIELGDDGCPKGSPFGWTPPSRTGHRGGTWEIRSYPPYFLGPGQQCVYDSAGKLITKGSAVGTPDHTAPVPVDWWIPVPKLFHCKDDCWQWIISEEYDHKTHPPNKGVGCPENDGKDYPPSKSKCPKLDNRL